MNQRIIVFFLIVLMSTGFLTLANCTVDYLGFSTSSEEKEKESNQSPRAISSILSYCNPFYGNGFRGLLTAYYDADQQSYTHNMTWLYLWEVPFELKSPSNYAQFHRFYIKNNLEVYNKAPVEAEIIQLSSSDKISITTVINKDLLSDLGGLSMEQLISKHGFLLHDMSGWQGVSLSVFDGQNKPVKVVKILIPPFEANPTRFLSKHNQEALLLKLHPFEAISVLKETNDKIFYNKSKDSCQKAPIPLNLPDFESLSLPKTNSSDQTIEELSNIIPSFQ